MSTQKVRVTLDITVDPEAWLLAYGLDAASDLADYVMHHILGSAAADAGCITRVDLR